MGDFVSNWADPWVLVEWGGRVAGQRRKTRFGFITEAVARDGEIKGFRVRTLSATTGKWTMTAPLYRPGEIVKMWRTRPSDTAIRKAKAALKPEAST